MPEASLSELQTQFAAHLRDPESVAAPDGIEDRRMAIYRRLFFNNMRNFLGSYFPVLKTVYGDKGWATLIRAFYRDFRARTPLFTELPREFLRYLTDHHVSGEEDPTFLTELAQYEWVRHALAIDERELPPDPATEFNLEDLADTVPVLSALALPMSYRFPVHRIREDYQPDTPPDEPTHLMVYRDRKFKVRFLKLNTVAMMLANAIRSEPDLSCRDQLAGIARDISHPNPDTVLKHGCELLDQWRGKDIVVKFDRSEGRC